MERHDLRMSDLEGVLWGQFIQPSALWVTLLFSIPDRWLCNCFLSITCCLEMAFPPPSHQAHLRYQFISMYFRNIGGNYLIETEVWQHYECLMDSGGGFVIAAVISLKGCVASLSIIARKKLTVSGLLALELIILQLWEVLDLRSLFVNNNYNLFLRHWHVSSYLIIRIM